MRRNDWARSVVRSASVVLSLCASKSHADINLEFRTSSPMVHVGEQFDVALYAWSDDPFSDQSFSAVEVVFQWPTDNIQLLSLVGGGDVDLVIEGFPVTGSNGLNEAQPPQDGDGLYIGWVDLGATALATPAGTRITTMRFQALNVTADAPIDIAEYGGFPIRPTIVYSGEVPNLPVTGTLTGTSVEVRPIPCGPADLNEDGVLDFFDVQLFLNAFSLGDPIADFASPQGVFDFFDALVYLQIFSDGCVPPTSRNLGLVADQLLHYDPYVVILGDSHAQELPARFWYGFKSVSAYAPTSYSNGFSNHPARLARSVAVTPSRSVDASTEYELHDGSGVYYAVPTFRVEEFLNQQTVGWTTSIRITAGNGLLPAEWIAASDDVQIKPLFLGSIPGLQEPTVRINGLEYDCSGLPVALLAAPVPFIDVDSERMILIDTNQTGSQLSLLYGGCIVQKVDALGQRLPGPHEVWKADNTFQHEGMICNCPSNGLKQFTREQMKADLLARSISPNQQPIVVVNLANQMNSREDHREILDGYMEESLYWFDGVSNQPPRVLFIVSFAHNINGNRAAEMQNADNMAWAARDLCEVNSRASYVSLFALMDRTYATTDDQAGAPVNADFHDWALANGFDAFEYDGQVYDLSWEWLDPSLIHLKDAPTAAACGTLLLDELLDSLP